MHTPPPPTPIICGYQELITTFEESAPHMCVY